MLKIKCLLLLEALLFLLTARLLLGLIPVPRLVGLLSRPLHGAAETSSPVQDQAIASVHDAILWVWRRGWLRDRCFHRAIAAHLMLRRRNIPTRFHYGAATLPERGLTGHVWLTAGETFVVGGDQASRYRHLFDWGQ